DLIGLHGTDPASVFLAAAARMKKPTVEGIERALYDDRTIVRMLAMRRTMFVVPTGLVPMVQAAASNAVAARERKRLVQWIEASGLAANGARWLRAAEAAALEALRTHGAGTAAELAGHAPVLREQIRVGGGKWETTQSVGARVLLVLAAEGQIARGRPRGSWISTQHRWELMDAWLPNGVPEMSVDEARIELATRWLRAFGPATVADVQWWTGWTLGETRKVIERLAVTQVDLDGANGIALADDLDSSRRPKPWVALLPALDPTVMGWTARDWYLGEHRLALFDRSGNAGPTVWWDGRIVGGWAQRASGEIVSRLLEDVGKDVAGAIEAEAERLEAWLGSRRLIPRFRTPLERELVS
ncbi:MAG: hypothetical protein QOC92_4206, partial [Acidimicrobiaceae bacterium]